MPNPTTAAPISIAQLDEAVISIAGYPEASTSYHLAYQAIPALLCRTGLHHRDELIIGAHFTYGWMQQDYKAAQSKSGAIGPIWKPVLAWRAIMPSQHYKQGFPA